MAGETARNLTRAVVKSGLPIPGWLGWWMFGDCCRMPFGMSCSNWQMRLVGPQVVT